MRLKYMLISALLVVALTGLCGLATAAASQYPMTVTDNFNRTATLAKAPERIVSLSPSNTELLFALGVGGRSSAPTTTATTRQKRTTSPT